MTSYHARDRYAAIASLSFKIIIIIRRVVANCLSHLILEPTWKLENLKKLWIVRSIVLIYYILLYRIVLIYYIQLYCYKFTELLCYYIASTELCWYYIATVQNSYVCENTPVVLHSLMGVQLTSLLQIYIFYIDHIYHHNIDQHQIDKRITLYITIVYSFFHFTEIYFCLFRLYISPFFKWSTLNQKV
jgi:hypothetical protein